jgi:hypothetical protein
MALMFFYTTIVDIGWTKLGQPVIGMSTMHDDRRPRPWSEINPGPSDLPCNALPLFLYNWLHFIVQQT